MVTSAPNDAANFTAMWPNPPKPKMATLCPLPTFQWRNGEKVVTPAQSNGATRGKSNLSETCKV